MQSHVVLPAPQFLANAKNLPALLANAKSARGRIRTCDLLLRRQSLYPLSYAGGIG